MTDMMRKSKSSDVQEEFSKRIDQEIKRMSDYVQSVCLEIANKDKEYQVKNRHFCVKNTVLGLETKDFCWIRNGVRL